MFLGILCVANSANCTGCDLGIARGENTRYEMHMSVYPDWRGMQMIGFVAPRRMLLGSLLAAAVMGGGAMSAAAQDTHEMVITNELATSHWTVGVMKDYADKLEANSNGRIKPKIFNAGTLYNDQDALAALGTGAVHMVWPVAVRLETVAPETGVLSLPFALNDEMMARAGAPEAVGRYLSKYLEPVGIEVLGVARTADLFFLTRKAPIEKMDDLSGMKIRATGGRVLLDLLGKFGASSVALPAPEMGPAISQGAIDGALTSAGGWEMVGPDTVPYASLIPGLNMVTYAIIVDQNWMEGLPEDLRTILKDTTAEFVGTNWPDAKRLDQQALDAIIARGGKFSMVSDEAREDFVEAAITINENWKAAHPEAWSEFDQAVAPFR